MDDGHLDQVPPVQPGLLCFQALLLRVKFSFLQPSNQIPLVSGTPFLPPPPPKAGLVFREPRDGRQHYGMFFYIKSPLGIFLTRWVEFL